jgi:hypothetical protein
LERRESITRDFILKRISYAAVNAAAIIDI